MAAQKNVPTPDASSKPDNKNQDPPEKLIPITIRFTESAYDVISHIAETNGRSKADIVRLCVDDRLLQYLSDVVFIDRAHGRDLRDMFNYLTKELSRIRYEINKIGVNYNQEVRRLNAQVKAGNKNVQPLFNGKAYNPVLATLREDVIRMERAIGKIIR